MLTTPLALHDTYTDDDLINRYRETGDKEYIGILFKRYLHLVFGVCMKYLKDEDKSEDASMQVFEKLFEDLKKHSITHFKSWLYSVAKNQCLMNMRKEKTLQRHENEINKDSSLFVEIDVELHQKNKEDKETLLGMLENGMKNLNEEQRICIQLFYIEEKCYQEVAQLTGYSMNQVKSYIQNGKRNLKLFLTKND